jgi:hypothetical protein
MRCFYRWGERRWWQENDRSESAEVKSRSMRVKRMSDSFQRSSSLSLPRSRGGTSESR